MTCGGGFVVRTLLGALLLAGCAGQRPADPPPPVRDPEVRSVETCVLSTGRVTKVRVEISATGDTTFQGQPFRTAFPLTPEYATGADWYERNEPIPETVWPVDSARGDYVKYGSPRVLPADTLAPLSVHHGVPIFSALGDPPAKYGMLYVPVRPGCWFHDYQYAGVAEVREG